PRGRLPTPYCPFRHFPQRASPLGFVRLACLIHAANVRSEPGSNPSKKDAWGKLPSPSNPLAHAQGGADAVEIKPSKSLRSPGGFDSKELATETCISVSKVCVEPTGSTHPRFGLRCLPNCQRPTEEATRPRQRRVSCRCGIVPR